MTLDIDRLQNLDVFDRTGDKIGAIGQIYVDDNTGEPTFVTVKTGLFGTKETFVPVQQAEQVNEGIRVPYDKSFVKDAPNLDADGHLSESEQDDLYTYYGIGNEDLGQYGGRSDHPGEERLRGAPGVGTAGYGEPRQAARDEAEGRGDARRTQAFDREGARRENLRDDQRVHGDDDLARDDLERDGLIDENRGRTAQQDVEAARYERPDSGTMGDAGAAGAAGAMGAAATARERRRSLDETDDRDDVHRVDLTDRDDLRERRDRREDIGQSPELERDLDRDRDRDRDGGYDRGDARDRTRDGDWDREHDRRAGGGGMRLRKY